jgi:DNA-binding XRE family transcriptional regulator
MSRSSAALSVLNDRLQQQTAQEFSLALERLYREVPCVDSTRNLVGQAIMHSLPPSVKPRTTKPDPGNTTKGSAMSYGTISKTLRERVSVALRRRMYPNTNLSRQQLADRIEISDGTMANLLSARTDPSGPVLDKLIRCFKDGFINEVFGCHDIHCVDTRAPERAALVRQILHATEQLRAVG